MSNLESKTLKQILDESNIAYSFKGWAGDSQLILNQKYVAEVFAQKEITEAKQIAVAVEEDRKLLESKIEAANKITEKRNSNWVWATPAKLATLNREKLELLALDFEKMLSNVEKALEVPRKEGCKIGGLPQNVPACPELKEQTERKEEAKLTCDKSKEPPCHLEPSIELCKKCLLDTKENTTP
jgi:hypothetical protein